MDKRLKLLFLFLLVIPLLQCCRTCSKQVDHDCDDDDCDCDCCSSCSCDTLWSMDKDIPTCPAQYIEHIKKMCGYGCQVSKRIIGGTSVKQGHFPWMVAIVEGKETDPVKCGGALISQQYVLTVASCVVAGAIYPGKNFMVKLGDIKLHKACEMIPHQCINVPPANVIGVQSGGPGNSLALLKLERKVKFNSAVRPICLPFHQLTKGMDILNKAAYVAGWGNIGVLDSRSMCLKQTRVKILCLGECLQMFPGSQLDAARFCAVPYKSNKRPSFGDEGSPLMVPSCTGKWIAFGIFARPNKTETPIYFNVHHFLSWILANSDLHV